MGANHSHEPAAAAQAKPRPQSAAAPSRPPPRREPSTPPAQPKREQTPGTPPPLAAVANGGDTPQVVCIDIKAPANQRCSGLYDVEPQQTNGHTWWRCGSWALYSDPSGYWILGGVRTMQQGLGWFATKTQHKGMPPTDTRLAWCYMDVRNQEQGWKDNAPLKITADSPQQRKPAPQHVDPQGQLPNVRRPQQQQQQQPTQGQYVFRKITGSSTAQSATVDVFATALHTEAWLLPVLGLSNVSQAVECFNVLALGGASFTVRELEWFLAYRRYFSLIDTQEVGSISAWDLEVALTTTTKLQDRLGLQPHLAQSLVRLLDVSGDGRVVWLDFARYFLAHPGGFEKDQVKKHAAKDNASIAARLMVAIYHRIGKAGRRVSLRDLSRVLENDHTAQIELGLPHHKTEHLYNLVKAYNPCSGDGVRPENIEMFLNIMVLFNKFDVARNGYIDNWEFGAALGQDPKLQTALNVQLAQAQKVFQQIDTGRTGSICFSEFYVYFMKAGLPVRPMQAQAQAPYGQRFGAGAPVKSQPPQHPEDAFDLTKKLGEGSYGMVYLAKRKTDGLKVIIKLPKLSMVQFEDVRNEASLLMCMKHPNIIRFIDAFKNKKGALLIVTEFADGGDLRRYIDRECPRGIPAETLFSMFAQTLEAVQYFHARGVMHRDLKPDNIFLTAGGCVKVGDLGLAKYLKDGVTHTVFQGPRGVASYMAPEQVRGLAHSLPIDIWALGCICYEMATGRPCFIGPESVLAYPGRLSHPPPAHVEKIVLKMLTADPRVRPTASHVLAALPARVRNVDDASNTMASYVRKPRQPAAEPQRHAAAAAPPAVAAAAAPAAPDSSGSSDSADIGRFGPLAGEHSRKPVAHPSAIFSSTDNTLA